MVSLDNSAYNVKEFLGLDPKKFLAIDKHLTSVYDLKVTKIIFLGRERTWWKRGNRRKTAISVVPEITRFEGLCKVLEQEGFDISILINEFNIAQIPDEIYEIRHVFSLAKLCYAYLNEGYNVEILKKSNEEKSPDLKINNFRADLKVRREEDFAEYMLKQLEIDEFENNIIYKIKVDLRKFLSQDMEQAIKSRINEGREQADNIIFDFSYLKSRRGIQLLCPDLDPSKPIPPMKNRVIVFSSRVVNGTVIPEFSWTYLEYDPEHFDFIIPSRA